MNSQPTRLKNEQINEKKKNVATDDLLKLKSALRNFSKWDNLQIGLCGWLKDSLSNFKGVKEKMQREQLSLNAIWIKNPPEIR